MELTAQDIKDLLFEVFVLQRENMRLRSANAELTNLLNQQNEATREEQPQQ